MTKLNKDTILAIDLGNYNIKTSSGVIFESRYEELGTVEDFDNEVLELDCKFYRMESGDFENEFNKSKKNYIPNLLYAISKSVETDVAEISLVLGVPASNLGITSTIKEDLENKTFSFKVFGVSKLVKINRVATIAEGLSSFYTLKKEERAKDVLILDIGGRTINVCTFSREKNIDKFTQPGGMLDLYSDVQATYNNAGNNATVEEVIRLIRKEDISFENEKLNFINKQLNAIKLKINNFNTYKIWVTGGGSLDLQAQLSATLGNVYYIPNSIFSNVNGNKAVADLKWSDK